MYNGGIFFRRPQYESSNLCIESGANSHQHVRRRIWEEETIQVQRNVALGDFTPHRLCSDLKVVEQELTRWNREVFGNIHARIKSTIQEIEAVQQLDPTKEEEAEIKRDVADIFGCQYEIFVIALR